MQNRQSALLSKQKLRVSGPERAGDNHSVGVAKVLGCVSNVDLCTKLPKSLHICGIAQVRAGYLVAHADGEPSDARHSATADPDEMHGT